MASSLVAPILPTPPARLTESVDEFCTYMKIGVDHIMTSLETPILSTADYGSLYNTVFNFFTATHFQYEVEQHPGDTLYAKLTEWLGMHFDSINEKALALQGEELLRYYASEWDRCTVRAKYQDRIFSYFNRYWVARTKQERNVKGDRDVIHSVFKLVLSQWYTHVLIPIQNDNSKLVGAVLRLIERERNGDVVDQDLIRKVVNSLVSLSLDNTDSDKESRNIYPNSHFDTLLIDALGSDNTNAVKEALDVYIEHFETPLIDASEAYYRLESEAFLSDHTISEYLRKVEERLQQEDDRVARYLHAETRATLLPACEHVLIGEKEELLWENFAKLIDSDQDEDLQRMHRLLARIPESVEPMRKRFEGHVKWEGLSSTTTVGEGRRDVEESGHDASLDSMVKDFVDL